MQTINKNLNALNSLAPPGLVPTVASSTYETVRRIHIIQSVPSKQGCKRPTVAAKRSLETKEFILNLWIILNFYKSVDQVNLGYNYHQIPR